MACLCRISLKERRNKSKSSCDAQMMCRYFHNKEIEKILSNPQKVARKNVKFENFVISSKIVKSASLLEGCVVIYITN